MEDSRSPYLVLRLGDLIEQNGISFLGWNIVGISVHQPMKKPISNTV